MDTRVTALEENAGDDGNSSVVELEVRVEALEGTTADHETRISDTEVDVNGRHGVYILFIVHFRFSGKHQRKKCTLKVDRSN